MNRIKREIRARKIKTAPRRKLCGSALRYSKNTEPSSYWIRLIPVRISTLKKAHSTVHVHALQTFFGILRFLFHRKQENEIRKSVRICSHRCLSGKTNTLESYLNQYVSQSAFLKRSTRFLFSPSIRISAIPDPTSDTIPTFKECTSFSWTVMDCGSSNSYTRR